MPIRQRRVPAARNRASARRVKGPPRHARTQLQHRGRSHALLVTSLAGAPAARRVRRLRARAQPGRAGGESGPFAAERAVRRGAGTRPAGNFGARRLHPEPVRHDRRSGQRADHGGARPSVGRLRHRDRPVDRRRRLGARRGGEDHRRGSRIPARIGEAASAVPDDLSGATDRGATAAVLPTRTGPESTDA